MKSDAEVQTEDISLSSLWTVGHSTHSFSAFGDILLAHRITALVDVRSFPGSRRYPQFNQQELSAALQSRGITYSHNPRLGGRRRPVPDSRNTAWRNASFRAYADHMATEEFREGIVSLLQLAAQQRTVFMCAESLWWRCHRSLIADWLKAMGHEVVHILDASKTEIHPFTSAARIVAGRLSYAGLFDVE
jgi:uncharacterized protein (DUF488 family)